MDHRPQTGEGPNAQGDRAAATPQQARQQEMGAQQGAFGLQQAPAAELPSAPAEQQPQHELPCERKVQGQQGDGDEAPNGEEVAQAAASGTGHAVAATSAMVLPPPPPQPQGAAGAPAVAASMLARDDDIPPPPPPVKAAAPPAGTPAAAPMQDAAARRDEPRADAKVDAQSSRAPCPTRKGRAYLCYCRLRVFKQFTVRVNCGYKKNGDRATLEKCPMAMQERRMDQWRRR